MLGSGPTALADPGDRSVSGIAVFGADGGTTTFRFNYIHDSLWGLNFKSRSHFTQLLYNHIAHSADGEVSLVDSVSTDQANSHALMLGRVDGVVFDVAVFLNLGRDHLDFHETLEDYYRAKASLFTPERARRALDGVFGTAPSP